MSATKAALNVQELKSKLFTKLTKEGKLDSIRASMRSEVIKCFYSDKLENRAQLPDEHSSSELQLEIVNWLIGEHLVRNRYEFTRSVFNLEAGPGRRRSQLNVVEVLQHLGIELNSDYGKKTIEYYADSNNHLFVWQLLNLCSEFKSVTASKCDKAEPTTQLEKMEKADNSIIDNLHRRLKQIDEFYDKKKELTHLTARPNFNLDANLKSNSTAIDGYLHKSAPKTDSVDDYLKSNIITNNILETSSTRNVYEPDKNNFMLSSNPKDLAEINLQEVELVRVKSEWEALRQSQEAELQSEKKRLEQLKDELEFRERQWKSQKENERRERLRWENKCREIDSHHLELNNLQQRLETRERQLELRERQHIQMLNDARTFKEELNKNSVYGDGIGADYLAALRGEYEGKLNDSLTRTRYWQNKLQISEDINRHESFRHKQQCVVFKEQLKLQRERITFLQGVIQELKMQLQKRNLHHSLDPFYFSTFPHHKTVIGDSILMGVDLQETYFDTSLNASNLAPELELNGKQLGNASSELESVGELSSIRTRIRQLESEADRLEYRYSRLDKSKLDETDVKLSRLLHVTFEDGIFDRSEPTFSANLTDLMKPETLHDDTLKDEKTLVNLKERPEFVVTDSSPTSQHNLTQNPNRNHKISEDVIELKTLEDSNKSKEYNSAVKEVLLCVDDQKNTEKVEGHSLGFLSSKSNGNSEEVKSLDYSNESENESRLSPRSSTPIEAPKVSSDGSKHEIEENSEIQSDDIGKVGEQISWEKISAGSDDGFEW